MLLLKNRVQQSLDIIYQHVALIWLELESIC